MSLRKGPWRSPWTRISSLCLFVSPRRLLRWNLKSQKMSPLEFGASKLETARTRQDSWKPDRQRWLFGRALSTCRIRGIFLCACIYLPEPRREGSGKDMVWTSRFLALACILSHHCILTHQNTSYLNHSLEMLCDQPFYKLHFLNWAVHESRCALSRSFCCSVAERVCHFVDHDMWTLEKNKGLRKTLAQDPTEREKSQLWQGAAPRRLERMTLFARGA